MRVIILSKAPVAGHVKTRLLPDYSEDEAASLQKKMASVVVHKALNFCKDVWLAVDDINHPFFQSLASQYPTVMLCQQGGGDLGARLTILAEQSYHTDRKPLMFLGTDSPHVSIDRYRQAELQIMRHDIVIGAVEDGGYDLIVIKKANKSVFEGIAWGSETVLHETLQRCDHEGLQVFVLPMSFDLDRPEDLVRSPPESWQA